MKKFSDFKKQQKINKEKAIKSIVSGEHTDFKLDLSKKGEKDGLCNRSSCLSDNKVIYWNKGSHAWYCERCADIINQSNRRFSDVIELTGDGFLCKTEDGYLPYSKEIRD